MFKNNLKIAWRNLVRDRQFTWLNLVGLSTGLACTFLIYLWVSDEMHMDKFHTNDSRLYQVMQNGPQGNDVIATTERTPDMLGNGLKDAVPGIEDAVTLKFPDGDDSPKGILSLNNQSIKAAEIFATSNFFDVFSFKLLEGDKNRVLDKQENIVLSEDMAMRLFHTTKNVVGKVVKWDRGTGEAARLSGTYIVSGICQNPPAASSLQFDVLFSNALYVARSGDYINWGSNNVSTYVLLKKDADVKQAGALIKGYLKSKFSPTSDDYKWIGTLFLQKFSDRYLYGHYENGLITGGRINYVKLFSIIALFVLIIACINFMNLATAKATRRIKEVGIKKVVGASRMELVWQYIGESMLMAFLSVFLAAILVIILLPAFKEITGKNISISINTEVIISILAITIFTGVVAGSYPALYLSRFRPALVLKGKVATGAGESWVRKGLVVFQFTLSIALIIAVMVVYNQMQLIQTKSLGYNKDNIIHFPAEGGLSGNEQAFIDEAKTIPGVLNTTDMEGDMLGNMSGGGGIDWPRKTEHIEFGGLYVDYDFMQTMGMQMQQGRMFSPTYATDTDGVVFNETAIKQMHLQNPVGKTVSMWGYKRHIIGIVKDFHEESLYKPIGPFFIAYRKNTSNILVKIKAGKEKETLAGLEELYKKYNPGLPFEYSFIDEDYQALYAPEQRVAVLSRYFAGVAIIISCLGLFGLTAFTAQKRQKEIGIRKVIGASVTGITVMLSKDFLVLVLIAVLVAFPVAWWAMHAWLQSFAYRATIDASIFIIAGVSIIVITLFTVSFQSIKAALSNPVEALKNE